MNLLLDDFSTRLGQMLCAVGPDGEVAWLSFAPDRAAEREAGALRALQRAGHSIARRAGAGAPVAAQVDEYLAGDRRSFDLELRPDGTDFQREVWWALRRIDYGETRSYRDIAIEIGRPRAVRAVARANATNPISLVVPCHRVIGSDGSLTGFGGGLPIKQALLELEASGAGAAVRADGAAAAR